MPPPPPIPKASSFFVVSPVIRSTSWCWFSNYNLEIFLPLLVSLSAAGVVDIYDMMMMSIMYIHIDRQMIHVCWTQSVEENSCRWMNGQKYKLSIKLSYFQLSWNYIMSRLLMMTYRWVRNYFCRREARWSILCKCGGEKKMNNIAILIGGTNGNNQWWMGDLKVVNQLRRRCNFAFLCSWSWIFAFSFILLVAI